PQMVHGAQVPRRGLSPVRGRGAHRAVPSHRRVRRVAVWTGSGKGRKLVIADSLLAGVRVEAGDRPFSFSHLGSSPPAPAGVSCAGALVAVPTTAAARTAPPMPQ